MSNLVPVNNQQIATAPLQIQTMDDLSRMSKMMADSGFFSDCQSAAQAGAKIMAGIEIGVPAFASLSGIHIIKGKATIGANLMAAKIKASGKYTYKVLEHTDLICKISFYERFNGKWEEIGVSEFTAEDAHKMGTQHMTKMPKNMLFARSLSNGCKWYCPDVFLGVPVYTPDELGAEVDDDGDVISVKAEVSPQPVQTQVHPQQPTSPDIRQRLEVLMGHTGHTQAQVYSIAAKNQINPDFMNHDEYLKIRDFCLADWAMKFNVFNAKKHAWNAFKSIINPSVEFYQDDDVVIGLWQADIDQRVQEVPQGAELETA